MEQLWNDFRKTVLDTILTSVGILFALFPVFVETGEIERVLVLLPVGFSTIQSLLDYADRGFLPGWAVGKRLVWLQGLVIVLSVLSTIAILFNVVLLLNGFHIDFPKYPLGDEMVSPFFALAALSACIFGAGSIADVIFKVSLLKKMWSMLCWFPGSDRPGKDYITPMLWEVRRRVR